MSLNVSPLSPQEYDSLLKAFIKTVEGEETLVYVDYTGKDKQGNLLRGNPTIGWGFALNDNFKLKKPLPRNPKALDDFLHTVLGVNPDRENLSASAKIREKYWQDELKRVLNSVWVSDNSLKHTGSSKLLRSALNDVLDRRSKDIATNNYTLNDRTLIGTPKTIFKYDSAAQIAATFDAFKQDKEDMLDVFGTNLPQNCYERIALFSMAYQGTLLSNNKVRQEALVAALNMPNAKDARAEAWYVIRYLRTSEPWRGYTESALFGLYDDDTNVKLDDAQAAFKMFTSHRDVIIDYETKNQTSLDKPIDTAKAMIKKAGMAGICSVQTILEALDLAKTPLLADLRNRYPDIADKLLDSSFISTNIYLNPHKPDDMYRSCTLDSLPYQLLYEPDGTDDLMIGMDQEDYICGNKGDDVLIGEAGNDFLWGGEGRDVLYGGEGNDFLWGDEGNDTMYGGLDDDIYFISPGDGEDRIEDKHGNNKIVFCFKEINFFYEIDEGQYKSLDGSLTGEILNGELHVTLDGATNTKVILNEDFQWGDFGITLIDLPDDIPALPDFGPLYALSGDLTPIDMDPVQEGVQYGYDQWGNVIVDPDLPDPGRSDVLYDTIGSDKIEGLGGNDTIYVTRGNGDWVLGGDGNDTIDIQANGNILVEGESGNDYIETTADTLLNARIYGGTGDDMIMMDSNGSGWVYGGEGSDLIDGERLNNCIIEGGAEPPRDYRFSFFSTKKFFSQDPQAHFFVDKSFIFCIINATILTRLSLS